MVQKKKILVIEDEKKIGELLRYNLYSDGYRVQVINHPRDLERHLNLWKPDIILLDVGLPMKNGYQILRELRKREDTSHLKVLMVSARTQIKDMEKAYALGADGYITKPFDPLTISNRIRMAR